MKVKSSIQDLKPYIPNELPYILKIDANESENYLFPEGIKLDQIEFNRYPDSYATELRKSLGKYVGVDEKMIIAGNGSSEMIELILKTFIEPNDKIIGFEPSFSMYSIFSKIYGADYISLSSEPDFSLNMSKMIFSSNQLNPKLIFICSPNNPTGFQFRMNEIVDLIENTNAIVVLDEAYIEFSSRPESLVSFVNSFSNLVVLRTLSKAFGLAGARLGYLVANKTLVEVLNTVKSPYNLNSITQYVGVQALGQIDKMKEFTKKIIQEKQLLNQALKKLGMETYLSEANFIFFKFSQIDLFKKLTEKKILIRQFGQHLKNYYRVTVGSKEQNAVFISSLKEIIDENSNN